MPLASTARPARIGRRLGSLPSRVDRLGHQRGRSASCRPPLRPASTSTAAASSAKSCPRLPRRELAAHAAQSGERQRRSAPQTSRRLPDFEAAPWPLLLHPWGSQPAWATSLPGAQNRCRLHGARCPMSGNAMGASGVDVGVWLLGAGSSQCTKRPVDATVSQKTG